MCRASKLLLWIWHNYNTNTCRWYKRHIYTSILPREIYVYISEIKFLTQIKPYSHICVSVCICKYSYFYIYKVPIVQRTIIKGWLIHKASNHIFHKISMYSGEKHKIFLINFNKNVTKFSSTFKIFFCLEFYLIVWSGDSFIKCKTRTMMSFITVII